MLNSQLIREIKINSHIKNWIIQWRSTLKKTKWWKSKHKKNNQLKKHIEKNSSQPRLTWLTRDSRYEIKIIPQKKLQSLRADNLISMNEIKKKKHKTRLKLIWDNLQNPWPWSWKITKQNS
jgi:hypothetical protein